jgi:hypothetical protein
MQRVPARFLTILLLLALLLSSCGLFRREEKLEVDLTEFLPEDFRSIGRAQSLDVDQDGDDEWLVFYHVDLVRGNWEGSPTLAAVFRPVHDQDSRMPPSLVPALLWLPGQGYLCLRECEAEMREVISSAPGKELVVTDQECKETKCEKTVGVAVFRWQDDLRKDAPWRPRDPEKFSAFSVRGGFVPLGYFRGDEVEVKKDQVIVIHMHNDRSDLISREIYGPQSGTYYLQPQQHVDDPDSQMRPPEEAEVFFSPGPPVEPTEVKVPEKLVLAFYQNMHSLNENYFTPDAWDRIGPNCPPNMCGCSSRWEDVSRVMVKQVAYKPEFYETVEVGVRVVCVRKGDQTDPVGTVTWKVERRPDATWRLADVTPGCRPDLCPPYSNWPARAGE